MCLHFSKDIFGDGGRARCGLPVRLSDRADITLSGSKVDRQPAAVCTRRVCPRTHDQRAGESSVFIQDLCVSLYFKLLSVAGFVLMKNRFSQSEKRFPESQVVNDRIITESFICKVIMIDLLMI